MKTLLSIVLVTLFSLSVTFALPNSFSKEKNELIEKNLLVGINSDNFGLKTSAAYFLGENKSDKAVLPLLKMLHEEQSEEARILAALSLIKIGNSIGVYAVKRAGLFDESEKVRKMCNLFFNTYSNANS